MSTPQRLSRLGTRTMVKTSGGDEIPVSHTAEWNGVVTITAEKNMTISDKITPVIRTTTVGNPPDGGPSTVSVTIDMRLLKSIVAAWLRDSLSNALEEASDDDLLKGQW